MKIRYVPVHAVRESIWLWVKFLGGIVLSIAAFFAAFPWTFVLWSWLVQYSAWVFTYGHDLHLT